ncbi:hypothetical protein HDU96_008141 [Phlyctochytrium bullatum]|nr:hypothetical protein HDU96_008141 [Phlyctochytrium bullatum]
MNWRTIPGAVSTGVKELIGNFTRAIGKESTAVARVDDRGPAKPENQIPTAFWVSAVDMVGDLKTGYLLNATPKAQFYAQILCSALSIVMTAPLFVLFTKAYPCVMYPAEIDKCTFQTPSVAAWLAVATVLTGNTTPIPI